MTKTESGLISDSFIARLKTILPLGRFNNDELRAILGLSKIVQYDPNDVIIRENAYDNRVYFLITGELRIEKGGQPVKVLWETGSVFGEMGIIEGVARSATVIAQKKSVCLALDVAFVERIKDHGGIDILQRIFIEALADRLRSTTDELSRTNRDMNALKKENQTLKNLLINIQTLTGKTAELLNASNIPAFSDDEA